MTSDAQTPGPLDNMRAISREPPAAEVTRRLLDVLLSGDVAPGHRIPSERQLTKVLGVGRSAVREGIKSLSLLGLLDVRQGDGTYLAGSSSALLPRVIEWGLLLGEPGLKDLLEARWHLEVLVAGLAAERADAAAISELRERLETMRRAPDVHSYIDADVALHLALAEASGNQVFADLLARIRSLLLVWATRVLEHAGETETSLAVHEPIVAAVERGDVAAARSAMEAHMERASRRLRQALDARGGEGGEGGAETATAPSG